MIGYKAFFNKDGKLFTGGVGGSLKIEWEIGETKKLDGEVSLCNKGFHFFEEKNFCFAVNFFEGEVVICKIEARGEIKKDTYKCVCSEITVLEDCTKWVLNKIDNKNNSGNSNSGDSNSGDSNSGNRNSGNSNSGYSNSGNSNSGDSNSGNSNSGIFNTNEPCMRSFNKPTKIKMSDWINSGNYIYFDLDLTDKTYKEAWAEWWKNNKSKEMRLKIKALPNFDSKIFEEITGIKTRR